MTYRQKRSFILTLIPVVIATMMFFVYLAVSSGHAKTLQDEALEINHLQNDLETKRMASEAQADLIQNQVTGMDKDRKSVDDNLATALFGGDNGIFQWRGYDEYMQAREYMIDVLKVPEDDALLTDFFPYLPDNDGINAIDYSETGQLNATFEKLESYVIGMKNDEYNYFTFITWSIHGSNGGETMHTSVLTYTVNSNGDIYNIMAYR